MSELPPLARRIQTLRIIYASFGAAIFVYTLVLAFNRDATGASDKIVALRPALTLAAVMFAGASIWWRRRAARAMREAPPEELLDGSSFERLRTNCIISWSFSQSVAVMGLVMGLLTGELNEFVPYGLAALVLLMAHRPSVWPHWPLAARAEAARVALQSSSAVSAATQTVFDESQGHRDGGTMRSPVT
jgi:hypothetical protein